LERNFSKSRLQVDALFLSLTAAGIIQLLKNSESTEFANIGAGISGRFKNTKELKVMDYNEAVSGPDGERWKAGQEQVSANACKQGVQSCATKRFAIGHKSPSIAFGQLKRKVMAHCMVV
jgi:hypothetical protein